MAPVGTKEDQPCRPGAAMSPSAAGGEETDLAVQVWWQQVGFLLVFAGYHNGFAFGLSVWDPDLFPSLFVNLAREELFRNIIGVCVLISM